MIDTQRKPRAASAHVGGRVRLAIAVLAVALAVLAFTPVAVSIRTRALRNEITEVAQPTASTVSEIERTVALQLAALRGFALFGDTSFIHQYRALNVEETRAAQRLRTLAGQLGPQVQREVTKLLNTEDEWDAAAGRVLQPGATPATIVNLLSSSARPQAILTQAADLHRYVQFIESTWRRDIAAAEGVEIWVNRVMIVIAAIAALALALLGRQLHGLTEAAELSRAELERELARRARLIRGISHDLKNPLGAAAAHAALLEEGIKGPLLDEQRDSLRAIRRSVRSTVRLIDDLLHLARAERGEIPINFVEVDFVRLVTDIATDSRSEAESSGLRFELELPGFPVRGITDPRRTREIVGNLVTNAIRYTPAGGLIRVLLQPLQPPVDSRPATGARISVSDTGPGIAPEDRERIFEEFERVGRGGPGSGLGLAISREMARLLGGEIELESEIGRGSTFSLVLPAEPHASDEDSGKSE